MPNRLADATSPYLLQHQHNPVDWWPWCDEAFAEAKRLNRPVFLSVGYSSCHWCHVMAHESFEDEEVAQVLNRNFISIKVDREERPDVDEVYMTAVQLASGHGGWPMSVFLTPDRKPFFAGTYFPKQARGPQQPGFVQICQAIGRSWQSQRLELTRSADEFAKELEATLNRKVLPLVNGLTTKVLDEGVQALLADADMKWGGFQGAPKFPPHSAIRFMVTYASLRGELPEAKDELVTKAGQWAALSLAMIARGGIHDHVGGGFHRYSTDDRWYLPHFEKMLSDNAQLLELFAILGDEPLFASAREGIVRWLAREMTLPNGMFGSALDADSEGEEGLYYTWTLDELEQAAGPAAGTIAQGYACDKEGNYLDEATRRRTGRNVLHLVGEPQDLTALALAREARPRPGFDDKAIAAWNGLMIGALAIAGETTLADAAAEAWVLLLQDRTRLPHQFAKGQANGVGFLDDYAFMARGLFMLGQVTGNPAWLAASQELVEQMIELFLDPEDGAFFFLSSEHEQLFGRTKPMMDRAEPSPNAVAAWLLGEFGQPEMARRCLEAGVGWMQRMPRATESLLEATLMNLLVALPEEASEPVLPAIDEQPVQAAPKVRVELLPREVPMGSDGFGHAVLRLTIPDGIHLNTNTPPARWLTPTTLKVEGLLGEAAFPEGEEDRYVGVVEIPIRLSSKGRTAEFELTVGFQPCTEQECLLPQEVRIDGVLLAG